MRTDDPQITTQGAYRQLDPSVGVPGPGQGQRGQARKKQTPQPRPRGKPTVKARRGLDETDDKNLLGEKAKNPHQLRNPIERLKRRLGPIGRARTGITRRQKGKTRTFEGVHLASAGLTSSPKASPKAKRREANRGKLPHSGGSPPKRRGGGPGGRNVPP
jgi:hypothetical protein